MPRRIIEVDGAQWQVAMSGRSTQYNKDEFGLVFTRGTGARSRAARGALLAARRQEPGAVPRRNSATASWPTCWPSRSPAGPHPSWVTAADRHRSGTACRPVHRSPRPLERIGREPGAGGRGVTRPGRGLTAISLTDHDTVAGVPAAVAAGERVGVRVVSGCEFSPPRPGARCTSWGISFRPTARCSRTSSRVAVRIASGAPAPWWTACATWG